MYHLTNDAWAWPKRQIMPHIGLSNGEVLNTHFLDGANLRGCGILLEADGIF